MRAFERRIEDAMQLRGVTLSFLAAASLLSAPGRSFGETPAPPQVATTVASAETNLCTDQLVMGDPQVSPGPRFQSKAQGKLTAADLHRLQLKWAFGYANVSFAAAADDRRWATVRCQREWQRLCAQPADRIAATGLSRRRQACPVPLSSVPIGTRRAIGASLSTSATGKPTRMRGCTDRAADLDSQGR